MSATRAEGMRDGVPPVPGAAALGWLLLMRPLMLRRLLEAWGFAGFVTWSGLGQCAAAGDEVARALRRRWMAWLGVVVPWATLMALAMAAAVGVAVDWRMLVPRWLFCALVSVLFGWLSSLMLGMHRSALGVTVAFATGYTSLGVFADVVEAPALVRTGWELGIGLTLCGAVLALGRLPRRWVVSMAAVGGVVMWGSEMWHERSWVGGVLFVAVWLRLPLLVIEVPLMLALRVMQWRDPAAGPRLARWLPYRWDDLVLVPLPGLRGFLMALAARDRALAEVLIEEAAGSIGQQGVALRAWAALGRAPGGPSLAGA